MTMNPIKSLFWSLLFAGTAVAQGTPDPQHALAGRALVDALRAGGHVIYFRHADTGPAYGEQGVDLARCETQRNLNDNGREQARLIGAAFRQLRIPVGQVRSSEFCRCKETAQIAFGGFEIDPMLTGASRSAEAAPRRQQGVAALGKMLATSPAPGRNTVLISHGFNLWDTEGFHLGTQGEAAIYRPDGKGGYVLVARLLPRQWSELAQAPAR
jgi:phosphohistidine phosphatase SixA